MVSNGYLFDWLVLNTRGTQFSVRWRYREAGSIRIIISSSSSSAACTLRYEKVNDSSPIIKQISGHTGYAHLHCGRLDGGMRRLRPLGRLTGYFLKCIDQQGSICHFSIGPRDRIGLLLYHFRCLKGRETTTHARELCPRIVQILLHNKLFHGSR